MAAKFWSGAASATNTNWNANVVGVTNWGSASGVADNVAAPTVADTVTFDGVGVLGNSNSTISATISCLSLTITAGYTATMTHNAVLSLGTGGWTMNNTHTIAGSSAIALLGSITITSNGQTWPNNLNSTTASKTLTLVGNFVMNGSYVCSLNIGNNINKTTTETFSCKGFSCSSNAGIDGTADLILTGGTWSATVSSGDITSNLTLAGGNITISGTVYYNIGTLTYSSGTITSGSLAVGNCTLNLSGMVLTTLTTAVANATVTLTSTLTLVNLSPTSANFQINKTTSEEVRTTNLVMSATLINGTAIIFLGSGTWSGTSQVGTTLHIDGNATIAASVSFGTGTLKYISGTVDTTTNSSVLNLSSCTLDTVGITWYNVILSNSTGLTYTINSSFNVSNTLTLGTGASTIFAGTAGFTVATLSHPSTAGGNTVTLKEAITYTITAAFNCNTTRVGSTVLFTSAHGTTRANILMPNNGSNLCNVLANFTRIDATGGRTVTTFGGTITDCVNVRQFYDYYGIAF